MEPSAPSAKDMGNRGVGPRHSILDLAPLELECLTALWPMGEGTVRDIHRELSIARKRAYTTVLTIMDRLAQKGIVTRHKVGRAYLYRANLSADEARLKAVEKIVAGFRAAASGQEPDAHQRNEIEPEDSPVDEKRRISPAHGGALRTFDLPGADPCGRRGHG